MFYIQYAMKKSWFWQLILLVLCVDLVVWAYGPRESALLWVAAGIFLICIWVYRHQLTCICRRRALHGFRQELFYRWIYVWWSVLVPLLYLMFSSFPWQPETYVRAITIWFVASSLPVCVNYFTWKWTSNLLVWWIYLFVCVLTILRYLLYTYWIIGSSM